MYHIERLIDVHILPTKSKEHVWLFLEKKWIEKYFLFVKLKTIPICKQNYIPKRHSNCFIAKCKLKTKWFEYLYEKEFLILYWSPDTLLAVKLSSSFFSYMY